MKNFLTFFLVWLLAFSAMAETTLKAKSALSAAGGYVTSHNKVDGSFEDEITSWSASVGTIVKTASTEIQGNNLGVWSGTGTGTLDLQWTATASNTYDANAFVNVGGEDDVYVCAYVGTTETGCKLIPALDKIQKVSVVADSKLGEAFYLRLKHTGSDAFSVKADDGKIEPQAFQNVQVVEQESISYTGYSSRTASNQVKFALLDSSNSYYAKIISPDLTTTTHTKIDFIKAANIQASASVAVTNNDVHSSRIIHYNSSGVIQKQSRSSGSNYSDSTSLNTKVAIGDYLLITNTSVNAIENTSDTHFSITATAITDSVVQSYSTDRVGETIYSIQNVAPQGFISAQGSVLGKTTGSHQGDAYKALYDYAWAIASATAGEPYLISSAKGASAQADWDAGKTITINESGLFTRASGGNAGAVGAKQLDAFQTHTHGISAFNAGGSSYGHIASSQLSSVLTTSTVQEVTAPNSGRVDANETRPTNVAKYVYIRYAQSVPTLLALPQSKENVFSASVSSSGVLTSKNTDWISAVVRNSAGNYTVTFKSGIFTTAPIPISSLLDSASDNGQKITVTSVTSSSINFITFNNSTVIDKGFSFAVQKQSPDYTAPGVLISNLNPDGFNKTSGTTGLVESFSFSYGTTNATTGCSASPCSYLDQIGNNVTSMTRISTGQYTVNFSKTYAKLKCNSNVYQAATTGSKQAPPIRCENCSSVTFDTVIPQVGSYDTYGTLLCQGIPR